MMAKSEPKRHFFGSLINAIHESVKWILIKIVRLYQLTISPWIGQSCRHSPTCSAYMIEAIREWGAVRGVWLGVKRIGKCHPWGTSGYDPVPKKGDRNESVKQTESE